MPWAADEAIGKQVFKSGSRFSHRFNIEQGAFWEGTKAYSPCCVPLRLPLKVIANSPVAHPDRITAVCSRNFRTCEACIECDLP